MWGSPTRTEQQGTKEQQGHTLRPVAILLAFACTTQAMHVQVSFAILLAFACQSDAMHVQVSLKFRFQRVIHRLAAWQR